MGERETPVVRCAWCRKMMPEGAEACPHCRRAVRTDELRPLGEGAEPAAEEGAGGKRWEKPPATIAEEHRIRRAPPAEGQEPAGSWAQIRGIAQADKVFAAMLAILALQVLMAFLSASILGALLGGLILWGVLSFQWWGYWLALLGALFGLLASVSSMGMGMASAIQSGTIELGLIYFAMPAATNLFIALALFTRRQHFDL